VEDAALFELLQVAEGAVQVDLDHTDVLFELLVLVVVDLGEADAL